MKKKLITLLFILPYCLFAQQQVTLSSASNKQELITIGSDQLLFEASTSSFQLSPVTKNGASYQRIILDNFLNGAKIGSPELPVYNQLIEIPLGAKVKISVLESITTTIDLDEYNAGKLYPAQASVSKSSDPTTLPFSISSSVYSSNTISKLEDVAITTLGKMRSVTIGQFSFSPFSYNPVTNELTIITQLKANVSFTSIDTEQQLLNQQKFQSNTFEGIWSKLANHSTISSPTKDLIVTYPVKYVIVADPMFQAALQPFVQWKTKKGFTVIQAYTNNPQVGNTTTSIKNYLQGLYNAATPGNPAPSYVLFVGDIDQIPSTSCDGGAHVSDLYYCEYDGGGDYFPEVYYGRFSANTVAELQPQIDKTIEYEKYLMPDPSYLNNVAMISGVDANMAPIHGNGQINYGTDTYFNVAHGFTPHVWLYPASEGNVEGAIISTINNGCGFINYTAHGYEEGWADPALSVTEVAAFTNNHKYGTMIGNCCLTNTFTIANCFGESLLRAQNKGAIGYIGGSNVSYWDEDYRWGVGNKNIILNPSYDAANLGAYDCNFHENGENTNDWFVTQSQMIFAGNLAVTESGSGLTKYYWEIYHLMGDPSLMTYMTQPDAMVVNHAQQDVVGITSLVVNAEPHAYVAISVNGVLLDAKHTGTSSSVTLTFSAVNTIELLDVVVTKQNKQPYFGTVQLISPTNTPFIVLNSHLNDDSQANNNTQVDFNESILLDVELKNIGDLTGNNIVATLSTSDTYVTITDNQESWGTINANTAELITASYTYQVANNIPDQHLIDFLLTITDDAGHTWTYHINVVANAPAIEVLDLSIDDAAGNNNGHLDAGETVQLSITARNNGHAELLLSNGSITTPSASLTITNGATAIGTMAINSIVTGVYTINVSPTAGFGEIVSITNLVGTATYSDDKLFQLPIGLMDEDFESNTLTEYDWTNSSPIPWFTTATSPYEGLYCSQSGDITDNEESNIIISIDVLAPGEISFMKKTSTESGYDFLNFYIDNALQDSWSGTTDWSPQTYSVTSGTHVFKWSYTKDQSESVDNDAVWLDNILFPPMIASNAGIQEEQIYFISVYPNPATDVVTISFESSIQSTTNEIVIRDIQGKVVYQLSGLTNSNNTVINTSHFSNGVYFIELNCGTIKETKLFVKQ